MRAAFSLCCWDKGPVRLLLARRLLERSEPSLTEKMDWCGVGEVSALYDVLLAPSSDRRAVPAAGEVAEAWAEIKEGVSFLNGGETDCVGVGGAGCCVEPTGGPPCPGGGAGDLDSSVFGGASSRLGAGCMLDINRSRLYNSPRCIIKQRRDQSKRRTME